MGRGLARVISMKGGELKKRGVDLRLCALCGRKGSVVGDINPFEAIRWNSLEESNLFVKRNFVELIDELDVDIVVEATPTNIVDGEPGLSHIMAALESGKHVVTSNKGPLALKFAELMALAGRRGKALKFEATCVPACPCLTLLKNVCS